VLEGSVSHFHIITPQGETIQGSQYNFTASLSETGCYQCVGKLDASEIVITEMHYLYVYGKCLLCYCLFAGSVYATILHLHYLLWLPL